jgi:chromate transporter
MKIYIDLFITFFKIGLISFGGGYAMIPIIQNQVEAHQWLDTAQLTDVVAVSAMAPGPIAANSATIVGYKISSLQGAIVASIGVTLPSILLVILLGSLFFKYQENYYVKAAFYGLRSVIVGLIGYTAIKFAISNNIIGGVNIIDIKSVIIMGVAFVVLLKDKFHPVLVILSSAVAGILIF